MAFKQINIKMKIRTFFYHVHVHVIFCNSKGLHDRKHISFPKGYKKYRLSEYYMTYRNMNIEIEIIMHIHRNNYYMIAP